MPRRTWLDSKIDVFLEELAASGMHLDRQRAGELITGQVRAVATRMRVTEATARTYLDDEIIKDMARRMLFEVAGERPGADLMEAPRTVPLPLALVGITVAALAEAMQVRAANEPPDHLGDVITTYAQTLSGLGQITAGAAPGQAGNPAEILVPPALLRRAARYISGAADLAANGGKLPDGIPETARNQLAATLRRDADGLIAITATDGSLWPPALTRKRGPVGQAAAARAVFAWTGGRVAGCEPAGRGPDGRRCGRAAPGVSGGTSAGGGAGIHTASGTWPGGGGAPSWPVPGGASVLPPGGGVIVTVTVQPG